MPKKLSKQDKLNVTKQTKNPPFTVTDLVYQTLTKVGRFNYETTSVKVNRVRKKSKLCDFSSFQ